jgi:hypothetical protein
VTSTDSDASDGFTVPIPQAELAATINWKRGSKLLPNVEVTYNANTFCPPVGSTAVIGVDPGEVFTMTATKVDPANNVRESIRISRTFLYQPYLMFRTLLEEAKEAAGIDAIESDIPPMMLTKMDAYLQYMSSTAQDPNNAAVTTVRQKLLLFYHGKWFAKKSWDMRKAQKACYDYGIKAMLRLAGGNESTKVANPNSIFGIGLGSFNTRTGLATKHSALERRFVIRVCDKDTFYFLLFVLIIASYIWRSNCVLLCLLLSSVA